MSKTLDTVNAFPSMPDEAVISSTVTALLTGLSDRSIRRHPALMRGASIRTLDFSIEALKS
jgi:hypothetical protein